METKWCIECGETAAWSRGLCGTCYATARRNKELDEYPTDAYLKNPEAHIRWAFGNHPELIKDIAVEFGFRVI